MVAQDASVWLLFCLQGAVRAPLVSLCTAGCASRCHFFAGRVQRGFEHHGVLRTWAQPAVFARRQLC
jgi:hypothetical protein